MTSLMKGQIYLLLFMWLFLWVGHISDSALKAGVISTLVFAGLNFLADMLPNKNKDKSELSDVRESKNNGE